MVGVVRVQYPHHEMPTNQVSRLPAIGFALVIASPFALFSAVAIHAWLNPFNSSRADIYSAILILVASAVIALLAWLVSGRTLAALSLLAGVALVLVTAVTARVGWALLVLTWLALLSHALGQRTLRLLFKENGPPPTERAVFAVTLGFAYPSIVVFALGITGLLYTWLLALILIALTLAFSRSILTTVRGVTAARPWLLRGGFFDESPRLKGLVVACGVLAFALAYVWAIAPAIHYDALSYHLGVPEVYIRERRILELPYTYWSYLISHVSMLYTLALMIGGQPLPQLLHLLQGILLVAVTFLFGRRLFGVRVGLLAAGLLSTTPLFVWEAGTAYNDLWVSLFVVCAFFGVLSWREDGRDGWLGLSGLMTGMAVSAKFNAGLVLAPLCVLIVYHLIRAPLSWRERGLSLAKFLVPAFLVALPFFALRVIWTGNPVFPILSAVLGDEARAIDSPFLALAPTRRGLVDLLLLPWNVTFNTVSFMRGTPNGVGGVLLLLGLPLFLIKRPRRRLGLSLVLTVAGGVVIWFVIGKFLRYLLPAFPLLAVIAALNLDLAYEWLRRAEISRWVVHAAGTVLAVTLVAGTGLVMTVWHWHIPDRYPVRFALGLETREQFLSRAVPAYEALAFLDSQPQPLKVFSVGNEYRLYTRARIEGIWGSAEAGALVAGITDPRNLAMTLEVRQYTHVLINWRETDSRPGLDGIVVLSDGFLSNHTTLEFSSNDVSVYRLSREAGGEGGNLLGNPGFETLSPQGEPSGWIRYGNPVVDAGGGRARSGQVAVESRSEDGFYGRVAVEGGAEYKLAHWVRADAPDQNARLQINWMAANLELVDVTIRVVPAGREWARNELTVRSPKGASFAQVYASVHEDSRVWFDDFSFSGR